MSADELVPDEHAYQSLESIKQVTDLGAEYWSARDLATILGYDDYRHFEAVIEKATTACVQSGQVVVDHFVGAAKMVRIGSQTGRRVRDWHLSRYACYLIAQNGDPRKEQIALAQSYFAMQTRRQEIADRATELEKRKDLRNRVKDHNKALASAAKGAGVQAAMFGVFQDAGYRGLYDGLGVQDLKRIRGLDKEDVLDRMGRTELAANDFRITQAEEKLRRDHIHGQRQAIETHREVGEKVREAIRDIGGTMPEELPVEPSIKPLLDKEQRELRRLTRGPKKPKSE